MASTGSRIRKSPGKSELMRGREANDTSALPASRRRIFKLLSVLLPVFILLLIELLLRLAHVGNNYDLFVTGEKDGVEYYVMNEKIGTKYFTNFPYSQTQNRQFPKEKTADHLRIFVLGSSTAVGFPYAPNIAFPSQLERMIQQSFPHLKIEVINTSITAVNSYTLRDFTRMITKYEPDCILFYAGHNEYYGALGAGSNAWGGNSHWIKLLHIRFSDLRIYQVLTRLFSPNPDKQGKQENTQGQTLMQRLASDQEIAFGSKTYFKGIEHYCKNLDHIVTICKKNGIPIILSDLVSNVKDLNPFGSLEGSEQKNADAYFSSGQERYQAGEYSEAKEDLYQAKDLDCVRFRAPEEINQIIRKTALEKGVPMVEMRQEFEDNSPHGIIGAELMTEHVHPNRSGQFLMAKAFYKKFIETQDDPYMTSLSERELEECYENTVFTPYDSTFSKLIISDLLSAWPFAKDQSTASYINNYQPLSFVDSLAYSSILRSDKQLIRQHTIMASYYLEKGDSLMAVREYHACAQLSNFSNPYYNRAIKMLIEMGRRDLALPVAREAALRFDNTFAYLFLADMQAEAGHLQQAANTLQKYLQLSQNEEQLYEGYLMLYGIYKELGDQANADKYLDLIIKINPLYKMSGLNEGSPKELSPGNNKKLLQAQELLKAQKVDEAIALLKEIHEEEDNFLVTAILGQVMFTNGNEDAYIYLEKVFEKYSKDERLVESLIIANLRAGKEARARELYQLFKLSYPNSPSLPELKRLMEK